MAPGTWKVRASEASYLQGHRRVTPEILGMAYRGIAAAHKSPETSRMVVGTPEDNPLVKSLARELGIQIREKALEFRGHRL